MLFLFAPRSLFLRLRDHSPLSTLLFVVIRPLFFTAPMSFACFGYFPSSPSQGLFLVFFVFCLCVFFGSGPSLSFLLMYAIICEPFYMIGFLELFFSFPFLTRIFFALPTTVCLLCCPKSCILLLDSFLFFSLPLRMPTLFLPFRSGSLYP